jgi:hypothetical protein
MNFYKLKYFKIGTSLCGDDFKNEEETGYINLQQIISFTAVMKFIGTITGTHYGDYAIVYMSNNINYYIKPEEFSTLLSILCNIGYTI